jgi:hypothetical protein
MQQFELMRSNFVKVPPAMSSHLRIAAILMDVQALKTRLLSR